MNFEALQKAWQCQHANAKITIHADPAVLLKEIRCKQQQWGPLISGARWWKSVASF